MNRCTCNIPNCNGVECYFASPGDYDGDPEMDAWLAQCAREEAERDARINEQLAKKAA